MGVDVEDPTWSSDYERAVREHGKQTRGVWRFLREGRADEGLRRAKVAAVRG